MDLLWVVICAGIFSFLLAWALGANDVANAFGTSVGSKVVTLRQAIFLAAIVEFAGAFLMGSFVVEKMRRGIIKPELYEDNPDELMLGMLAVLIGCTCWLILATFLGLPVSTTHSIVGALLGFTLVAKGPDGVDWWEVGKIAISWVSSPGLAGLMSIALFLAVRFCILRRQSSLELGMKFLPLFYGFTLGALVFFIIFKGSPGLGLNDLPIWAMIVIVAAVAILATFLAWYFGLPYMRRHIYANFYENGEKKGDETFEVQGWKGTIARIFLSVTDRTVWLRNLILHRLSPNNFLNVLAQEEYVRATQLPKEESSSLKASAEIIENEALSNGDGVADVEAPEKISEGDETLLAKEINTTINKASIEEEVEFADHTEKFDPRTEELFSFLQVLTACVGGFAHGANDVSNSIAPFAVVIAIYMYDDTLQKTSTEWWILLMGGAGIVLGLATWGYRVMATIGHKVTKLTPSRGFTIEFGAAMTVLIASRLQIPVSTTHCVVGSVFFVGLADGIRAVNYKIVLGIFGSWVVTLPFTGLLTAGIYAFLYYVIYD